MSEAAQRAVELLGGVRATAAAMGVSPAAVVKWKRTRVPAERVLELERAVESRVTRYQLRPDVYGAP